VCRVLHKVKTNAWLVILTFWLMVFEQILSSYNRNLINQLIMVGVILI